LVWLLTTEQATIGYEVLKTLHKAYKVNGDGNLPYWQSTTERERDRESEMDVLTRRLFVGK